jgi:hypothetical protein
MQEIPMDATALLLSRIQFAFTISFHIIFPSFTIGLAAWLTVLEDGGPLLAPMPCADASTRARRCRAAAAAGRERRTAGLSEGNDSSKIRQVAVVPSKRSEVARLSCVVKEIADVLAPVLAPFCRSHPLSGDRRLADDDRDGIRRANC